MKILLVKWKNERQKYHTVGTFLKYHTVRTFLKYHTVGTFLKYHTVGTFPKYHTVGTFPKSNPKIVEIDAISIPVTHIYITAHYPGFGTGTSIKKSGRVNWFYGPKSLFLVK